MLLCYLSKAKEQYKIDQKLLSADKFQFDTFLFYFSTRPMYSEFKKALNNRKYIYVINSKLTYDQFEIREQNREKEHFEHFLTRKFLENCTRSNFHNFQINIFVSYSECFEFDNFIDRCQVYLRISK